MLKKGNKFFFTNIFTGSFVKSLATGELKTIIPNALWLFTDKILRQGLNFFLTAWIARYLGVDEFGLWNYAIAFVALFSFFSSLGLYNLLLRDFVKYPERRNELLGSAFVLKLIGGLVTLGLSVLTIYLLKPAVPFLHVLILITALGYIAQSLDVIDYFFQSQLKAKWVTYARTSSFLIFGSLKVIFIYLKCPLPYFIWTQSGELLFSAIMMILFYRKNCGSIFQWKIEFSLITTMLKQSMPILFSEVAILIYMRTDQVMIGDMISEGALGVYSAAVKLSEIWYFIPGIVCSSFFPSIITAHTLDPKEYRKKLQQLYDFLIWLSILLSVFVSIFSDSIVTMIYGVNFSAAATVLTVHIWSGAFVFIGFASNQQLIVENLMKISFYRTIFGVVANVVLNLCLIPSWGILGSAVATLIAQAFSSWLSNLFFRETRAIFWMNLNSINPLRLLHYITSPKH